jgi:predicted pyridoxine 5'-phosphate oxidase superfamily flavin-nucleotide-binding protein
VFTDAVRSIQTRKGSRDAYARFERSGRTSRDIDADFAAFIEAQTSVFLGTASADGQPYIQHRGGPPGFLRVLDARTLAFVDYTGNRQYISQGNRSESPLAFLFLVDFARLRRIKVWGRARVVEADAALQHLPPRIDAADVQAAIVSRDARIQALEAELARLSSS